MVPSLSRPWLRCFREELGIAPWLARREVARSLPIAPAPSTLIEPGREPRSIIVVVRYWAFLFTLENFFLPAPFFPWKTNVFR